MKYDIKIYGIEERQDNILKNKEILGLSDNDIMILKKEDRVTPQDRFPYKMCKKSFMGSVPEGITHRVVLQDDVELAPNFLYYVDKLINTQPNAIFMLTALDFKTRNNYGDNLKSPYIRVGQFVSGCALIVPVKYIYAMFNWLETTYPKIWTGHPHEDFAIKIFANMYGIPCLTTIPSLVQHLGDVSTCCDYVQPLRTAYFNDWEKADWDSNVVNRPYINIKEMNEYLKKEKELKALRELKAENI